MNSDPLRLPAAESLSAESLGQIALIQSMVFHLPDTTAIFRFVCRGLAAVPGTARIGYRSIPEDAAEPPPEDPSQQVRHFPLRMKEAEYGELWIQVADPQRFEPYVPYLENLSFMLAVIFEERRQRRLIQDYGQRLEQRVRERTQQLEMEVETRARAEAALKLSEERLRLAMEATQDGLWDWNVQTGEVYWNPRCYTMLGYEPDEFPMSLDKWFTLVHPEDREVVWPKVQRKLSGEGGSFEIEFRYRTKLGDWRWVIGRGRPSEWDGQGRVLRVVGTHVDINERKELAQQLQQSQKLEAIGTLTGGIAHDFNNILSIIIGNTEIALDDLQSWHPVYSHLNEIKVASMRAKDVVRQLLSFSRKSEQRKKPLHIQELLDESLQLMRASIPASIEIRSSSDANLKSIEADPTQIHQIIINLCTNAAHAMEKHGGILDVRLANVHVAAAEAALHAALSPGDYVQLRVGDNGCGIDPRIKDRIFDPYFTTKESGKGSGIGLSVVHGIVRDHNGAIAVDSALGIGTTITVWFPAIEAIPLAAPAETFNSPGGSERILFVDDEPAMTTMVRTALGRLGYQVETATDPLDALARFRSRPEAVDLLITDMSMPGMTGDQLITQVHALRPNLPTILCTGYSEKINPQRAEALGIGLYVEKPFRQSDLAAAVRKVLAATPRTPRPALGSPPLRP